MNLKSAENTANQNDEIILFRFKKIKSVLEFDDFAMKTGEALEQSESSDQSCPPPA